MSDSHKVSCGIHGLQDETFVCQHIAESLRSGAPVGFHWPAEQTGTRPDAWCSACEKRRIEAGGKWTREIEKELGVKLLCGACYDYAKSIWLKGRKVTQ